MPRLRILDFLVVSLFVFLCPHHSIAAPGPQDATANQSTSASSKGKQPPINIVLNLHMDPWGRKGDNHEALMDQYKRHRDAFLWLCNLAKQKGFKITAEMTGFCAEYVFRQNHATDFLDFMPGKTHVLGTHLHENYKEDSTPYVWAQSWDTKHAKRIFKDQILMINRIFTSLGYSEKDNHLIHGVVVECEDPADCYGVSRANDRPYSNFFDIVTGYGLLNHPYRTNASALYRRIFLEDLKGEFIAIPKPTAGFIGIMYNGFQDSRRVNLTLPIIRKDFILEYIEWKTYNILGLPPRPWVFGFDIHPLDLNKGFIGGDGKPIRETLPRFYDWVNAQFSDISNYATSVDVAKQYVEWEKRNPNTLIYDISGKYGQLQPNFLTKNIYYQLKGYGPHSFVFQAEYTLNQNKIYEFRRQMHEQALLVLPAGKASSIDLSRFITGRVKIIDRNGVNSGHDASKIPIAMEPILVVAFN